MRCVGTVGTSSTDPQFVGSPYNEQTSNGQRSLKSASASDTAAGTGARKVTLTYLAFTPGENLAGPYQETVILNGTAAVPTVNTNIGVVERMDVEAAGSGGVAAGDVSLMSANDGTGTAICKVVAGDTSTRLAQHYVAGNRQCFVTDVLAFGDTQPPFTLRVAKYPLTGVETEPWGDAPGLPQTVYYDAPLTPIAGPARIRLFVTPGDGSAHDYEGGFGYTDKVIGQTPS